MKRIGLLLLLVVLAAGSVFAQNKALSVDGDGDYVQIPESIWFDGDLTIEAWVFIRKHTNWSVVIGFGGADRVDVLFII